MHSRCSPQATGTTMAAASMVAASMLIALPVSLSLGQVLVHPSALFYIPPSLGQKFFFPSAKLTFPNMLSKLGIQHLGGGG